MSSERPILWSKNEKERDKILTRLIKLSAGQNLMVKNQYRKNLLPIKLNFNNYTPSL